MLSNDELRALADALERFSLGTGKIGKAADYLRACAEAQPVAYRQWDDDGGYWYYGDASCAEKDDELLYTHPVPAAPQAEPLSEEQMRAVLIAEARRIAVQAGEKDPDSLTLDEEMLAQVMLAGRAVERAHGIGGSDAGAD